MIGIDEVSRHVAHFGVPQSQIIRDHLISSSSSVAFESITRPSSGNGGTDANRSSPRRDNVPSALVRPTATEVSNSGQHVLRTQNESPTCSPINSTSISGPKSG